MRKLSIVVGVCALVGSAALVVAGDEKGQAKCICPTATPASVAWCGQCKVGMAFSQKTSSEKLITALEGKEIEESTLKCGGCKTAFKGNSRCAHCKVAFNSGKVYHSPIAQALSKGEVVVADKIRCAGCRANFEKGSGYCTHCNAGVVAGLLFKDQEDYNAAKEANDILASAINTAKTCQTCAVALVTDSTCARCQVTFNKGKPVRE